MRTVSALTEMGFSEESMTRRPIDWFAGVRALPCGSVAANARIAPEGMALQLSYHSQPKMSWASLSGRRMDSPALANSKRVAANGDSLVSGKTIAPTFENRDGNTATGLA